MGGNDTCDVPGKPMDPIYHGEFVFNTGVKDTFKTLDYIVLFSILLISALIGVYHIWETRQALSIKQFLLGGQSMQPFPVGMSLLGSFVSAVTFIGMPSDIYMNDTMYVWMVLAYFLVAASAAHVYCPVFYRLNVTTAFQYLELRFNKCIRTATSYCYILQMIPYITIALFAPSEAFLKYAGRDLLLWVSVVSVGMICTVYTSLGGMKAVLWTDTFQIFVMIASIFVIVIRTAIVVSDWQHVWEVNKKMNKLVFGDFRLDPNVRHTFWSVVIGGYFKWVTVFGVSQAEIQRTVACHTLRDAQRAIWMIFPGLTIILFLCCIIGIFMVAFYENCDPKFSELVFKSNQILSVFAVDTMGGVDGFYGFFIASVLCGTLSTISSVLNSVAACIMEDLLMNHGSSSLTERKAIIKTKVISMLVGFFCLLMTPVATFMGNILQATLTVQGLMGGPLLGVFSLGMFFPWANSKGAVAGLLGSIVLVITVAIESDFFSEPMHTMPTCISNCHFLLFENLNGNRSYIPSIRRRFLEARKSAPEPRDNSLSYLWLAPIGFFSCIVAGLVVSFLTGAQDPGQLDPYLLVPLCDVVFPFYYLPEYIRKPLRFGVVYERPSYMSSHFSSGGSVGAKTVQTKPADVPHSQKDPGDPEPDPEYVESEINIEARESNLSQA